MTSAFVLGITNAHLWDKGLYEGIAKVVADTFTGALYGMGGGLLAGGGTAAAMKGGRVIASVGASAEEGLGSVALHDASSTSTSTAAGGPGGEASGLRGLASEQGEALALKGDLGHGGGGGASKGAVRTFAKVGPGGSGRISVDEAVKAAEGHGIDMRMFDVRHDPDLPEEVYGFVSRSLDANFNPAGIVRSADGRIVLTLGDSGLISTQAAVETISHELNHVRGFLSTGQMSSEAAAEAAAQTARPYIK